MLLLQALATRRRSRCDGGNPKRALVGRRGPRCVRGGRIGTAFSDIRVVLAMHLRSRQSRQNTLGLSYRTKAIIAPISPSHALQTPAPWIKQSALRLCMRLPYSSAYSKARLSLSHHCHPAT